MSMPVIDHSDDLQHDKRIEKISILMKLPSHPDDPSCDDIPAHHYLPTYIDYVLLYHNSTLCVSTYGGTLGTLGDSFIPVRFSKREFGRSSQLFQRLAKLSCLAKFDCVGVLRL